MSGSDPEGVTTAVRPEVDENSNLLRRRFSALLRLTPTERQRLLVLTIISGGLCGLAAVAFHQGISFGESLLIERAMTASFPLWIYLGIAVPAIGGLIVGLGLHYWAPGAV